MDGERFKPLIDVVAYVSKLSRHADAITRRSRRGSRVLLRGNCQLRRHRFDEAAPRDTRRSAAPREVLEHMLAGML